MNEHREFKYAPLGDGKYRLIFPTGFKTYVDASSEVEIKTIIDKIIEDYSK